MHSRMSAQGQPGSDWLTPSLLPAQFHLAHKRWENVEFALISSHIYTIQQMSFATIGELKLQKAPMQSIMARQTTLQIQSESCCISRTVVSYQLPTIMSARAYTRIEHKHWIRYTNHFYLKMSLSMNPELVRSEVCLLGEKRGQY